MGILTAFAHRRSLARYAATLPGQLARDYGASPQYTPGQIRRASEKLGFDPAITTYGYAMFLDQTAFHALGLPSTSHGTYEAMRAEFIRCSPPRPTAPDNFHESGTGLTGGQF